MVWRRYGWLPLGVGLAVLAVGGAAYAACCAVPTTHVVRIPSVVFGSSSACTSSGCNTDCNCGTGGGGGGVGGGGGGRRHHGGFGGGGGGGFGGGGGGGGGGGSGTGGSGTGGTGGGGGQGGGGGTGGTGGGGGTGTGGGGGSGTGGGGGTGTGGAANGGTAGSGGSVSGSFNGGTTISITGSLLNQLAGNGTGTGTGTGAFTGAFSSNSSAFGLGGSITGSTNNNGGGGSGFYVDYNTGYIPSLNVEEAAAAAATASVNVPYQASRSVVKVVAVQAVCLDDKQIPHPASQLSPDKEISDQFEGELYRCIAGARMQFTVADYNGQVSFDHGQTVTCDKNSALYHVAGGRIECRPQKPARDCNERSLLRRFGAGIKILKIVWTETYTAYRTETQTVQATAQASASAMGMAIDGGVGGVVH